MLFRSEDAEFNFNKRTFPPTMPRDDASSDSIPAYVAFLGQIRVGGSQSESASVPRAPTVGDESLVYVLRNANGELLRDWLDALLLVTGSSWVEAVWMVLLGAGSM